MNQSVFSGFRCGCRQSPMQIYLSTHWVHPHLLWNETPRPPDQRKPARANIDPAFREQWPGETFCAVLYRNHLLFHACVWNTHADVYISLIIQDYPSTPDSRRPHRRRWSCRRSWWRTGRPWRCVWTVRSSSLTSSPPANTACHWPTSERVWSARLSRSFWLLRRMQNTDLLREPSMRFRNTGRDVIQLNSSQQFFHQNKHKVGLLWLYRDWC